MKTIYGDGVHDDAPGFNALMNGEPVQYASPEAAKAFRWNPETRTLTGAGAVAYLATPLRPPFNSTLSGLHVIAPNGWLGGPKPKDAEEQE